MADIELDDLSKRNRAPQSQPEPSLSSALPNSPDSSSDPVSAYWAWGTVLLLTTISIILSLSPRFLLFISQSADSDGIDKRTELTALESFIGVHASVWLLAIAACLVMNIPSETHLPQQHLPGRHPLLVPITAAACTSSFLAYNTTQPVGSLSGLVFVGSGIIGLWGLWAAVFGSETSVSKKTGADKHTSAFMFGNKSAASSQKKAWFKRQRRE